MNKKLIKRNLILGILFFLPVMFLLFLYPAKHHYNTLDIVKENVNDIHGFSSDTDETILLDDHITVLGFIGNDPMSHATGAMNMKQLIYDKFKGFKNFQIVMVVSKGMEEEAKKLKSEVNSYEELKYWHYVFADSEAIQELFNSLDCNEKLDSTLATPQIFIIDKDLNQRGRIDDRSDNDYATHQPSKTLLSYNFIEVSVIKNKLSEDVRILFTEYRQKRKGNFDSTTRRLNQLKGINED